MIAIDFLTSFARRSVGGARVRPYGLDVADLAIDFDAPRPIVATRVLAACLRCDEETVWSLAVQTRILLLLGISELSLADPIEAYLTCTCGATAIVELATDELARFAGERRRDDLTVAGITLRLPTGRDQLRWAQLAGSDDVARTVMSELAGERLSDALVAAADALLTEVDPLIELEVESACPSCDKPLARQIDLERIALTRLRNARRVLLQHVHAIASTYHWTETTIAELPAWRRAEYAALAEARPR
ncbi:MAG: hypothetical protein ABI591_34040 [Kofleriaceae bacterium]